METPPPVPPSVPPSLPTPSPAGPTRGVGQPATTGGKGLSPAIIVVIVCGVVFVGIAVVAILAGMMLPALAKAKQRAQAIRCVNNLKQLGLGARIYATDHGDAYPATWLQMTNQIVLPSLLVCPGDRQHHPGIEWSAVGEDNFSYEYLGKGANDLQTNRVIAICPIHGHVLLADGSIIQTRTPRQPVPVTRRGGAIWYNGAR